MNQTIIDLFENLIKQIEFDISTAQTAKEKITNEFRLKQIKNSLKIIKKYKKEITSGSELKGTPGIGPGTIRRVDEILATGKLKELKYITKKSQQKYMAQLEELTKVIGIGPRKANQLIKMGITSVEKFKKYAQNIDLPYQIKMGLKYYGIIKEQIPRSEMNQIDKVISDAVTLLDDGLTYVIAGSYRREKPTSNDIDVLITRKPKNKINYLKLLVNELKKNGYIIDDLDENMNKLYHGFFQLSKDHDVRRIDVRYIAPESWATALLYFTGSKDFNQYMRTRAIKLGYKLSEYGLYKITKQGYVKVPAITEKEIFDILDMKYLTPKQRI